MIVVKGDRVAFGIEGGGRKKIPARYGIIHDPEGKDLPRCEVFFGPYRVVAGRPEISRAAHKYFRDGYVPKCVTVDVPTGPWEPAAQVTHIYYFRRGMIRGGFNHPFRRGVELSKCGSWYRLALKNGCIVDDRGFVFP